MTTKLHIGNMPRTTTTQDIEGLFRPFGLVAAVALTMDSLTGQNTGCGTVEMDNDRFRLTLARQRISDTPGTTWRYPDAGFNLLGRVIENVTGGPFSDVLRDRLLHPLGMTSSSFEISRI